MANTIDDFDLGMKFVFGAEGAPSDNPVTDPYGGLTRFGISQTQNPTVDVANITQAEAVQWYKDTIWLANSCDKMPWPINIIVFDGEVNQGPSAANELLQSALGIGVDGIVGTETLDALQAVSDISDLAARILAKRAVSYTADDTWQYNGEGWMYRLMRLAIYSSTTSG